MPQKLLAILRRRPDGALPDGDIVQRWPIRSEAMSTVRLAHGLAGLDRPRADQTLHMTVAPLPLQLSQRLGSQWRTGGMIHLRAGQDGKLFANCEAQGSNLSAGCLRGLAPSSARRPSFLTSPYCFLGVRSPVVWHARLSIGRSPLTPGESGSRKPTTQTHGRWTFPSQPLARDRKLTTQIAPSDTSPELCSVP